VTEVGVSAVQLASRARRSAVGEPAPADASAQLDDMFETFDPLTADEIADLIACTTSRARHVNLRQVIVLPTRQA
jgi:NADP-dependent 3-hydroxy acid dehydrogenase YdfG